jgi:phage gp46-like protein
MPTDIAWDDSKGYLDISFTNGDYTTTNFLDTAVLMSLYIDKRATKSEVPNPQLRRGWWGNKVGDYPNYDIGSKFWLLQQARLTQETINLLKTYSYDCLKWLVDDGYVDRIDTNAETINGAAYVRVTFYISQNIIFQNMYKWYRWGE